MGSSAFSWLLGRRSGSSKESDSIKIVSPEEEEFGLTEQLRDFVKAFTVDTFKDFRLPNDVQNEPTKIEEYNRIEDKNETNVQKDLTEWQEKHALLVISSVKEIAKIRYNLCPRHMNDKEFWTIYFLLVKKFVSPYELHAIQKDRLKKMAMKDQASKDKNVIEVEMMSSKPLENTSSPPSVD